MAGTAKRAAVDPQTDYLGGVPPLWNSERKEDFKTSPGVFPCHRLKRYLRSSYT